MYVDAQTIILGGSLLAAISAFVALAWKLFKWINHQKEQDVEIAKNKAHTEKEIKRVEQKVDDEIRKLRDRHIKDQSGIQEEQTLVIYGLLACLKGLAEQGCDGPVSEAIDKIEKHINLKAHEHQ
ncbi:MAG: branched-chain amino acid ABC transporter permease [Clostridia bacterium]|nr:branched-chain amino acid ABC transporter permease [Clostridia bacterium]